MSEATPNRPRLSAGPGRLLVISGPSGVGKDTVLHDLFRLDPSLRYSVSYTTRSPRPGEIDGVSYSFVDDQTFAAMVEQGDFLEYAEVHGHQYGTSLQRVREALSRAEDVVLKIDVQGSKRVRRRVAGEALFVFLLPPSKEELRRRLIERESETPETLELRLRNALVELAEAEKYDHIIVNAQVDTAARRILEILEASRHPEEVTP